MQDTALAPCIYVNKFQRIYIPHLQSWERGPLKNARFKAPFNLFIVAIAMQDVVSINSTSNETI